MSASGIPRLMAISDRRALGRLLEDWVREMLPQRLRYEAPSETWDHFAASFAEMGGIFEAWIDIVSVLPPSPGLLVKKISWFAPKHSGVTLLNP